VGTNVKNVHDVIIGTGIMYINGVDVGQLKGSVTMKHSKVFYEEKAGFPSVTILKALIEEGAELTASLLEVNLDTIAGLMVEYTIDTEAAGSATITQEHAGAITSTRKTGLAHPKLTNDAVTVALASTLSAAVIATDTVLPVVDASIFTAGDTITLRLGSATEDATIAALGVDEVANTLTITAGLAAGFAAGASVINTAVALADGTDYFLDRLDGSVWRHSGSAKVAENDHVVVSYKYTTFTGRGITAGGISPSTYYTVRFEHTRRDGKVRVVELYRCQVTGDFEMAFNDAESAPLAVTVTAFSDSSRTAGDQLFSVWDRTV
jgi:hypothetical protein